MTSSHGHSESLPDSTLSHELSSGETRVSRTSLTKAERTRILGRCIDILFRWYTAKSQVSRNWHPDISFDWRRIRTNPSPRLITIVEGYYAVEQFAPDYTSGLAHLCREGYGRSHFQVMWGAEETRHADVWRNVLLFSRARTIQQLEDYTETLRANSWTPPWNDPLHMLFYTVFQERATELIYLNTNAMLKQVGKPDNLGLDRDSVLQAVISTVAKDEAAHYNFYLEAARLSLHYLPEDALPALVDVLREFIMPASKLVPNYEGFIQELYAAMIFGRHKYACDVVEPVLGKLGIDARQAFHARLFSRRTGSSGDDNKEQGEVALEVPLKQDVLGEFVCHLVRRLETYTKEIGLSEIGGYEPVPILG